MRNIRSFFLSALGILVLVGVGGGCVPKEKKTAPVFSIVTTSTRPGWKTYINTDMHFQIDLPSDWKIGEYVFQSAPRTLVEVAFDPTEVLSQNEFESIDKPPGRIWIDLTSIGQYVSTTGRLLGPQKIQVSYAKMRMGNDASNPFWQHKIEEVYLFSGPLHSSRSLHVYYSDVEERDSLLQATLNNVIQSFQLTSPIQE